MPLTVAPRKVTRSVKLLTDPSPRFASIVRHGANQIPFRSVKWAGPTSGIVGGKDYTIEDTDPADDLPDWMVEPVQKKGDAPYGDVAYADPGYQKDGKKRYPIDTADHVRAAWSYINKEKNASKYSSGQLSRIKGKIKAAAKRFGIEISQKEADDMPQPEIAVRDMTFKKANFATVAAVQSYLDDNGWQGFTITDKGATFHVTGEDVDDGMFESLQIVKMDNGVAANVGPLKANAEKNHVNGSVAETLEAGAAEDAKPIEEREGATTDTTVPASPQAGDTTLPDNGTSQKGAKATSVRVPANVAAVKKTALTKKTVEEETVKKWAYWGVYSSSELDLNGVIEDAMEQDSCPPGLSDVFDATRTAVANTLKADIIDDAQKREALMLIGSQFGAIVHSMYMAFSNVADGDDSVQASIKSDLPKTRKWMGDMAKFIKTEGKSLAQKLDTYGDNEGPVTPKSPASGNGNSPNDDAGTVPDGAKKPNAADEVTNDPAHGQGVDATTAGGLTGTDTAAVKASADEPEEVKKAREVIAAHEAAKKAAQPQAPATIDPKALAEAIGPVVKEAIAPVLKQVEGLTETVTVVKADTDKFLKRAPTKKSAATAGTEEQLIDPAHVATAKTEAEASQKFERRLRSNLLGL